MTRTDTQSTIFCKSSHRECERKVTSNNI